MGIGNMEKIISDGGPGTLHEQLAAQQAEIDELRGQLEAAQQAPPNPDQDEQEPEA